MTTYIKVKELRADALKSVYDERRAAAPHYEEEAQ